MVEKLLGSIETVLYNSTWKNINTMIISYSHNINYSYIKIFNLY